MKTRALKASDIKSDWVVLNAAGQTLGRLATTAAVMLMGKHKAAFSPYIDNGDHVVIVNAEQIHVTGKKLISKLYRRHSGYPGGLRTETLGQRLQKKPTMVLEHAIRGMLPKTRLGEAMMGKLRVYAGPEHPHQGQVSPGTGAEKRAKRATRRPATEERAPAAQSISGEEAEPMAT